MELRGSFCLRTLWQRGGGGGVSDPPGEHGFGEVPEGGGEGGPGTGEVPCRTSKYEPRCIAMGARFAPFVMGVWGSMAPGALELWQEVQRRLASHVAGPARNRYITELQQGLSLALQRGVAAQLQAINIVLEAGYVETTRPDSAPVSYPSPAAQDSTPLELD